MEQPPPNAEQSMETITPADGTEVAFEQTGSGPPLVLVHRNGDGHTFWELAGSRPAFAEHVTTYAIERRGRGESGDAAAYELEREAEDVAAVVDAIDDPVSCLAIPVEPFIRWRRPCEPTIYTNSS